MTRFGLRAKRVLVFLTTAGAVFASPGVQLVTPTVQTRVGYDSNPRADTTTQPSTDGSATWSASATLGVSAGGQAGSGKLLYTGDLNRYTDAASENFASHRLSGNLTTIASGAKVAADASALFIDGSRDTLASALPCNGNGVAVWRERREQWQYRAKLSAVVDSGAFRARALGSVLHTDYRTHVTPGRIGFADRGDRLGGIDLGVLRSGGAYAFAGIRTGRQTQDALALPGGQFEYSNRYHRVVLGWEGTLGSKTTIAASAGPDFRTYTGNIDRAHFGDRHHSFGWFDVALSTKFNSQWALTAKTTRWAWLSSTGKSAYMDLNNDVALTWTPNKQLSWRAGFKAHKCSYFPVYRKDWEFLGTAGVTYVFSKQWSVTADVLRHVGWNELPEYTNRDFRRNVVSIGATLSL